jgi:hypothetical protein
VRKRFIATPRNYTYGRALDLNTYQLLCQNVHRSKPAESKPILPLSATNVCGRRALNDSA